MAKKYVGLPLGPMLALCAILLLAPDSHGQGMTITRRTFTISGTTGVAGVTMQGFPVTGTTVTTDDNGVYTVEVPYEWSGTVKPVKAGYTFQPSERTYTKVVTNSIKEDYKPTVMTYTITGTTGEPNVKLIGFPDEVTSNAAGSYTATVVYGWAGTVLPEKSGYRFEPPSISYGPINKDAKDQNYKAFELTYTISGTAGTAGVTLNVTGFPKPVISGADGAYRVEVRHDWSGTIKPVKEGVEFTPTERTYQTVMENQTNQDYQYRVFTYQITGTTGMAGVIMKGLPDDPITDGSGFYSATVTYGSSLKVVPEKPGFRFEPPLKQYTNVKTNYESQDYKPSAIQLTISGTAGTGNVTLVGLPGDPQGDATGNYSAKVPFGFTGTVTPTKEGWSFEPPSYEYNSLAQDQVRQNFRAERIRFKITGNVGGMPQVTLMGFPTPVVSGPDGSYSADVDWNWSGKVMPRREGYTFEPVSREYKDLQMSQASQDYQPLIMKHSITGRVVDETGAPVADVIVAAEGEPPVTTGPDGKFELKVTHRWQGRISFQRDGYDFSPSTRAYQTVIADPPEVSIRAKIKMMTITDRIVFKEGAVEEPIANVKVTADPPGTNTVVTDATGKYSIKVPYGWTGVLIFSRPDLVFDPNTKPFTNVTEDIDSLNPKPAAPPVEPPPATTTTTPQPPLTTTTPAAPVPASAQEIQQRIQELNAEQSRLVTQINAYKQQGQQPPADMVQRFSDIPEEISGLMAQMRGAAPGPQAIAPPVRETVRPPVQPPVGQGPALAQAPLPDLISVLTELARQTGVTIAVDMTVKPDPVPVPLNRFVGLSVAEALRGIVASTKTPYKVETVNDRMYKVYRPVSNVVQGVDLISALQDLAMASGVPIIPDPNVAGQVNVSFDNVSLEEALDLVLAGKSYVYKRMPHYYLVTDRSMTGREFAEISETRRIRLNYMQAGRAKALLSPVFANYVQAELPNPRDPNDEGNTLVVTASPKMVDRIVQDIREIDRFRRQVLLDARVVVMERGDLLNLGVEWGWPTIRAGVFHDGAGTDTSLPIPGWPWGVQIGYSPDRTFTDSLMMALNLLQENSQADIIANPKVIAQDGRQAEIRVVQEEWFYMLPQSLQQSYYGFGSMGDLQKIESGTVLTITPRIGDNNDIMLEVAVEVSDSIPKARGSDLPLVTRRTAKNAVTVKDGGTVAVGGLTENRSKSSEKRVPVLSNIPLLGELFKNRNNDKASREVAVFVTAHLVPEGTQVAGASPGPTGPVDVSTMRSQPESPDEFRRRLEESIRQNR